MAALADIKDSHPYYAWQAEEGIPIVTGLRIEDLNEVEQLLEALTPRPANLERDRLFFRAGRASARQGYAWPLATLGVSALAAFAICVWLFK